MPEGHSKAITVYFDGASKGNPGPAGAGAVLFSNDHVKHEIKQYLGTATNNQAEYTALLLGLQAAREIGAKEVSVFGDSELVVKQLRGEYQVKDEKLKELNAKVVDTSRSFDKIKYAHVPREQNKYADRLANQAIEEPASQKDEVSGTWVELRVGSDALIPVVKNFIRDILEKARLLSENEPAMTILATIDRAYEELNGSGNGIYIHFSCNHKAAHMEIETESRKPLIYQHFKIPG